MCLPVDIIDFNIDKYIDISVLQKYFSDIFVAWPLILSIIGVSVVISLIYSLLIRYFAGFMMWFMILFFIIFTFFIGIATILLPEIQFLKDIVDYDSLP
jgi:uncharacterized membrane protein YagU involved in acid resistance